MNMLSNFLISILICVMTITSQAQDDQSRTFEIGDLAPPLKVRKWIKGIPVKKFEKGKVYVGVFWATWCGPCKAAMPPLSNLASKYKNNITFIGIHVMERKTTSKEKIQRFVDSMGQRMDYNVAAEQGNFMAADEWRLPEGRAYPALSWWMQKADSLDWLSQIPERSSA